MKIVLINVKTVVNCVSSVAIRKIALNVKI
jgi:hypothetical protein